MHFSLPARLAFIIGPSWTVCTVESRKAFASRRVPTLTSQESTVRR